MTDAGWMRRCLALARRAAGRTSPNPMVGCVVVGGGRVLAEAWHRRAGEPHAEAAALAMLGGRAPGATLYVSLEPCAHRGAGRRTEPCAPLVAASGVARVVYGMRDPFPGHGGGVEELAAAGVRVDGPVEEAACRALNEAFVVYAREQRAHVILKAAMTLDGKMAARPGDSRWITGEAARQDGHRVRDRVDAILVGAGTVIADDPMLTTRGVRGGRDPVRLVLDGRLRVSPGAKVFHTGSPAPTLVVTTKGASERKTRALAATGAEILRLPGRGARVDLRALVRELAARGMISLLVEGGGDTHAAFLAAGLCDRVILYVSPRAIGGRDAPSWLGGAGIARLAGARRFTWDGKPRRLGDDLRIDLLPVE